MPTRAEAIAAWTAWYEARPADARARVIHMNKHGIPEGQTAERIGAALALTPHERRCDHYGDKRYCTQCFTEQLEAEDTARREQRQAARRQRTARNQAATTAVSDAEPSRNRRRGKGRSR